MGKFPTLFFYLKEVIHIKKISIFLVLIILFTVFIPVKEVKANGFVVSGSSALKGSVIGALERSGVKFANKEAKDKAFQAWNMKAYEKWKADEALGKNADLWNEFNTIKASTPTVNVIDGLPGYGSTLLNSTFFGMAIAIGGEIGLSIKDAQLNQTRLNYLSEEYLPEPGVDFGPTLGFTQAWVVNTNSGWWQLTTFNPDGSVVATANSLFENDSAVYWRVNGLKKLGSTTYEISYTYTTRTWQGDLAGPYTETYQKSGIDVSSGYKYTAIPKLSEVPTINAPEVLTPLVTTVPDLGKVPQLMPSPQSVPVIVPMSQPNVVSDPFADNPYNSPYGEIIQGVDPGIKPEPKPEEKPGEEPIKEEDLEGLGCKRIKKIEFSPLGSAFTTSFPFSIPWDIQRLFNSAFSEIGNEEPQFSLAFINDGLRIKLPDYFDSWVGFGRGLLLLGFDAGLIYLFYRFMKGSDG